MLRYRRALQTSDTDKDKLLMDHSHQRDLSWQRAQRSKVMQGLRVHCARLCCVTSGAGSRMTRFPKQTSTASSSSTLGLAFRPCSPGTFSAWRQVFDPEQYICTIRVLVWF